MCGTVSLSAIGSAVSLAVPGLSLLGLVGSVSTLLGMIFVDKRRVFLRQNLLFGFGLSYGALFAPLIAVSTASNIISAMVGTTAILSAFTIVALKVKKSTTLMLAGPLVSGLLILVAAGIAQLSLPWMGVEDPAVYEGLYNFRLYLGLAVFSLYVAYDTRRMIERAKSGTADYVSDSLTMFLNTARIFTNLLRINRDNKD